MKEVFRQLLTILVFILWIITTLVLTISIIGIVPLFMLSEDSNWFEIPEDCLHKL